MKRFVMLLAALAVVMALSTGPAQAGGHEWHVEPHGHVMLIGAEIDGDQVTFDRCVEFAAGRILRGPAHHHSVHTGAAGGSPFVEGALFQAGNWVVPLFPFGPPVWLGCEDFTSPFPAP